MTKQEAIELMRVGVKITHDNFGDEEWMTHEGHYIKTEEGYLHDPHEFWSYRKDPCWEYGYSKKDA
jgi:hypothetical protein